MDYNPQLIVHPDRDSLSDSPDIVDGLSFDFVDRWIN
jgi:hypothetical protein